MDILYIALFLLLCYAITNITLEKDAAFEWFQSNLYFAGKIFKMKTHSSDQRTTSNTSNRRQTFQKIGNLSKKDTRTHRALTKVSQWHCTCPRCLRGNTARCLTFRCAECSVPRVHQTASYLERANQTTNYLA